MRELTDQQRESAQHIGQTLCAIGREDQYGGVVFVICNCPDFVEVGGLLVEHWRDGQKLGHLLQNGFVSTLRREIGEEHDTDNEEAVQKAITNGWTTFCNRDDHAEYQEGMNAARFIRTETDYELTMQENFIKYTFLLRHLGYSYQWHYIHTMSPIVQHYQPLAPAVIREINDREEQARHHDWIVRTHAEGTKTE